MRLLEWKRRMRRTLTNFALALSAALAVSTPASAADATYDGRLHVEFQDDMPAFVQTLGARRGEVDETSIQGYAKKVALGEHVRAPVGYAVKPAPAGCDRPESPCPSRSAVLPDDRAGDLPAGFNIEISEEPLAETARFHLRTARMYQDGPGSWVTPPAGQSPYPPYGKGTVRVLATLTGGLRRGALAQADCFAGAGICAVRITYASDLRVNFLSQENGEGLAKQVRAVDAVMRSVIRPGPTPEPRASRPPGRQEYPSSHSVYMPDLPLNRMRAAGGFTR
jgi:hypothetical protein